LAGPSAIAAPLAAATYLAVNDRKRLAIFLAALVGAGGGIVALMQRWTGGELVRHLFVYGYDGWRATRFFDGLLGFLAAPAAIGGLIALAALGAWIAWIGHGGTRDAAWYYFPWAALQLGFAGARGPLGDPFGGFALAAAVTIALGLAAIRVSPDPEAAPSPTPVALVAVPLLLAYLPAFSAFTSDYLPADRFRRDVAVDRLIRASPGPYFGEDVGLIVLAGKRPAFSNAEALAAAIAHGRWDPSALIADLRDGRFPFVYTESDLLKPDADARVRVHPMLLRAIEENYGPPLEGSAAYAYFPKVLWRARADRKGEAGGSPPR
jgi:hypothetical protein